MWSLGRSPAGGALLLLLLLLAVETAIGDEAARSEESAELLEDDDFLVRGDAVAPATATTGSQTSDSPFGESAPIRLREVGGVKLLNYCAVKAKDE